MSKDIDALVRDIDKAYGTLTIVETIIDELRPGLGDAERASLAREIQREAGMGFVSIWCVHYVLAKLMEHA